MIITTRKSVPLSWLLIAAMPWAGISFQYTVIGLAFVFSLRKFIDNSAGLTFVLSLPGFASIVLAPLANYLSDQMVGAPSFVGSRM
jgi:hypothetical protein